MPKPIMVDSESDSSKEDHFATTHWSLILTAGNPTSPDARAALSTLCQTYWQPVYAYVRRRTSDVSEAQDLTQEFFTRLLQRNDLAVADPSRGRFRSFLLTTLKHFLANEWKKEKAKKRGGDKTIFSLDFANVDSHYRFEPADDRDPERRFDRDWAVTTINHVLSRLRQEFIDAGKEIHFEQLKQFLTGNAEPNAPTQAAEILHLSEGTVRTAAHRLRKRYRELLKEEIARTVAAPEDVEEEIRNLFAIFSC